MKVWKAPECHPSITRILSSDKHKAANCEARPMVTLLDLIPKQPGRAREMHLARTAEN
ncbi:hypothetical protein DPMN_093064 [Dreissena polymorpha]|uniref:Uncharacterized protein n=1 Tax=Dreissena polymorpha TaxID=45954 RepID=A0A9D4L2F0_DREPO|nr:hypothetical protein DPMN_093064 [Dreissena polymorpha]